MPLREKTLTELREIEAKLKENLRYHPHSEIYRTRLRDVRHFIQIRKREERRPKMKR